VLIIPYIQSHPAILKNTLVAWDASTPEACWAIPCPCCGKRTGSSSCESMAIRQSSMTAKVSALHAILGDTGSMPASRGRRAPSISANTLLSHAADTVMGTYGHSRLREALLGGTTRTFLQSMTIPS
jgi:hypothetical protein